MLRVAARPSPNHDARPPGARPALVILHYTGMASAEAAVARLSDPAAKVSAHYVVDEDGTVLALVPENLRAWHAGVAGWRDIDDVNGQSIGIELVNPGHDWGYRPFPPAQIDALIELASGIVARHGLPPSAVIGHSDVAPARKIDPGELFPWAALARHGLGIWPTDPEPVEVDPPAAMADLARIGYRFDLPDTQPAQIIAAFQRHWRQVRVDGRLDAETMGLISAVARLCQSTAPPT
jgi:N-acetylmuramoyl-L-alanine amidase